MTSLPKQTNLDAENAEFWDELCGSALARSIGVTEPTTEGLARFDLAYLALYPYLQHYVPGGGFRGAKVLEIGLGYGTLGQMLIERGADYYGVDIAEGPVAMMGERVRRLDGDPAGRVVQASALALPFEEGTFDYVYSIGCLHHTGDLPRGVSEVHRVLAPGATAVIMVYNRHSYRRLTRAPIERLRLSLTGSSRRAQSMVRGWYDTNQAGDAAPHTDYVSKAEARRLFDRFSSVQIDTRNFDALSLFGGRLVLPRERLLDGRAAKLVGLDLYVTARK